MFLSITAGPETQRIWIESQTSNLDARATRLTNEPLDRHFPSDKLTVTVRQAKLDRKACLQSAMRPHSGHAGELVKRPKAVVRSSLPKSASVSF